MLPFAPGITGYFTEQDDILYLEIHSLRNLKTKTFATKDQTVISTIKADFSPILEDYLGDNLPGFSDIFFEMMEYPIPNAGEEREFEIFGDVKIKFCWIPVGEVQLGSPKEEQDYIANKIYGKERPGWLRSESETIRGMHKNNGFWLGKYPVTQSQWKAIVGGNLSYFKGENLPVENVSWDNCQGFIKKCKRLELKVQLPHENQWEYACRGGRGNKQAFYWGNTLNGDKANCYGDSPYGTDEQGKNLRKTSEVGSYEKIAPHPWGLCDMHGNVMEWCDNLYNNGLYRVARGGGFDSSSFFCRSSDRNWFNSSFYRNSLGFRLIIC